ncbi:MAG: hypothetical protein AMXMBFR84_33820 [Candidatus Hydrogenedentota bacterium]
MKAEPPRASRRHTVSRSDLSARYARLWLVALLLFTGLLSAGALFIKHELESVRETFLSVVKGQVGAEFNISSISVSGLRGFKVANLETVLALPGGPNVEVSVPEAVLHLNLFDLLSRTISIESVELRGATLVVDKFPEWLESQASPVRASFLANPLMPARFTGRECRLMLRSDGDDSLVSLTDMSLDIVRRPQTGWIQAEVSGAFNGSPDLPFDLTYQSNGDDQFHLRANTSVITPAEIALFWPDVGKYVDTAQMKQPVVTVDRIGDTLAAGLEAGFADFKAINQPDYLDALNGTLRAQGTFDVRSKSLNVTFAKVSSNALEAVISGDIRLDGEAPVFDLHVDGQSASVQPALEYYLKDPTAGYGQVSLDLDDPCLVSGSIAGTASELSGNFSATVSGGTAEYKPAKEEWPSATVQLGRIEVEWDVAEKSPRVFMRVQDGTIQHAKTKTQAESLAGMVTLQNSEIRIDPMTAEYRNQSLMIEGHYDIETRKGEAAFYGTVAGIEDTFIAETFKNVSVKGTAGLRGTAKADGDRYTLQADVDVTGVQIDHRWWFSKPAGLGLLGKVNVDIQSKKSMDITADVIAAESDIQAEAHFVPSGKQWNMIHCLCTSKNLDVMTAGMCLPIGYRITGGSVNNSSYKWEREPGSENPKAWRSSFAGIIDEIQLRATGADQPIQIKDVTVSGSMSEGDNPTGSLVVAAKEGIMPPFGGVWFSRFERDLNLYPPVDRYWTYDLSAETLDAKPWHGTGFKGNAFSTLNEFGLTSYSAVVDGGRIEGMYRKDQRENSYTAKNSWQDVPAKYFFDHLKLPYVFSGPMTGEVSYSQDRDDPSTLEGSGEFTMQNGEFSADFLLKQLQEQFEGASALPPSLKFASLDVDLAFQGDVVMTPSILLESDALKLKSEGQFVVGGDMDYEVTMAIAPEAAERIPALRESFNIAGHKISQNDIELAFKVNGPTLSPRSQIAGIPPVRVTLVSGALEAANEALRVIDAPRKILVDLLKIGGGIVGSRRANEGNS